MNSLIVNPNGHLSLAQDDSSTFAIPLDIAADLQSAFRESTATGLLRLAYPDLHGEIPPVLAYWRGFAQCLLLKLRDLGGASTATWAQLPPLSEKECESFVASAPPSRGMEYLSPQLLHSIWSQLHARILKRAAEHPDGAGGLTRQLHPHWQTIGRVTFHLAENKRDPQRPFAFLATLAHRMSASTTLQHLPLAEAVKQYATTSQQEKLQALLQPVQKAADRSELVRELLHSRALFSPQAWSPAQAHRFLTAVPLMQDSGIVVRVPNWWNPRQPARPLVQVRIGENSSSRTTSEILLDFNVSVCIEGQPLTDEERKQLLASNEGLVFLRGKWVEVNRAQLSDVLQHWEDLQANNREGISIIESLRLLADTTADRLSTLDDNTRQWTQVTSGEWLRATLSKIREPSSIEGCLPGDELQATLRPYQEDGVRWLWLMTQLGLGACLADDMGLGKTIQIIDLLLNMRRTRRQKRGNNNGDRNTYKSLLIVPASLIGNWKQEFERFAPTLNVIYAHRSEVSQADLERLAVDHGESLRSIDVVLTTFTYARTATWLSEFKWSLIVVDEAQAIKNSGSVQTKAIKRLPSEMRVALTGTPVENSLGDLWSIFDFCCPGLLGTATEFKKFVKHLGEGDPPRGFEPLRQLVRPYILRRLKSDQNVAPELPEKTEMKVECGLTKRQAVLYEGVVRDFKKQLDTVDGMNRRGLILSVMLQLKQICNHPSQFLHDGIYAPAESGKFERLSQICETVDERQERMLIFTQYQSLTGPLANFLMEIFGRPGLLLHGGTAVGKRKELVKQFQSDDGPPFFVISLKAGGSGLNLTAASHVVHFDRWWNPAVENQATDRAFRIGQKKNVLVHKFTCRGTVESRIDDMLRTKQALSDDILAAGDELPLTEMSDDQLIDLVKLDLRRATVD